MAKIKKFAILKTAAFLGIYSFFLGFVFLLLMLVFPFIVALLFGSSILSLISISFKFSYLIIFPLLYGVMGFVLGIITTPIINLVLKMIKGIDLDLDLGGHTY